MYQIDTTVVNLSISPRLSVARITSSLSQSYDLVEIRLTQKETLLEQRYFTGSMPLLAPNHSHTTCGGPKTFTSTTIFRKYGGTQAQNGRNATS